MKPFVKSAMALGVAGALTLAAATPSLARSRHWGPALGAGFVAGALIGAAAANANAYYGEPNGYYGPGPAYATPEYDAYGYAPGYTAPRYYNNTGPNQEDQLTGTGIGAND